MYYDILRKPSQDAKLTSICYPYSIARQDSGLRPSPLKHAQSKLLRVLSLHRTSDLRIFFQKIRVAEPIPAPQMTKKNTPSYGEAFFLVAGAGLEPATSWL
jgi:hypothetical protein